MNFIQGQRLSRRLSPSELGRCNTLCQLSATTGQLVNIWETKGVHENLLWDQSSSHGHAAEQHKGFEFGMLAPDGTRKSKLVATETIK